MSGRRAAAARGASGGQARPRAPRGPGRAADPARAAVARSVAAGALLVACLVLAVPACKRPTPPAAAGHRPVPPAGVAAPAPKPPGPAPGVGTAAATPASRPERLATVAGSFYPADPAKLRRRVRAYLAAARRVVRRSPRILLVPHAGYDYSGAVAAAAFRQVTAPFDRAVVLAANHDGRLRYGGLSVGRFRAYRGPGFAIPVSPAALELLRRPHFASVPAAHRMHMIEVELPFLREIARGAFAIVPLIAGALGKERIAAVANELSRLASSRTLFVFSIDLSHYHPYRVAVARDRACLQSLVRRDRGAIARCDTDATELLLVMDDLARKLRLRPRLVKYANSGDTAGARSRVVGYGALVYE